jgi:3-oxoacyl-[acyl-carrier protein] reductase
MVGKRLDGRVAIVTGSGRGIGRGIAKVLASEGAKVLVVDINDKDARQTANLIRRSAGEASYLKVDVTKPQEVEKMARTATRRYGKIDILCQNVGIYPSTPLDRMTEAEWDRVQSINLKSGFLAVKACLAQMKRQRYGRIVMTSSITGNRTALPGLTHYAASKGGINGFIKAAALELAKDNITVNGIEPGTVLTEGLKEQLSAEWRKEQEKAIPLGRLAQPEEIGYVALFLASDEAAYITGQTIIIDGGQTIVE